MAIHLRRLGIPILVASVLVASYGSAPAREQTETFISIGSGEMTGVYYPVVKAICQGHFTRAAGARHLVFAGDDTRLRL